LSFEYEFKQFYEYENLTKEREIELFLDLNDKNREEIVHSHLKLVLKISRPYCFKNKNLSLDIIQEGIIGLLESVDFFDLSYNCRFSTIASHLIKNKIRTFLNRNNKDKNLNKFYLHQKTYQKTSNAREDLEEKEKRKIINKLVHHHGDVSDKEIVALKYKDGKTWREISQILGGSHEKHRKRHKKFVKEIKKSFSDI
jgi:RNA polymerase sigma factor (sigma-70 family)